MNRLLVLASLYALGASSPARSQGQITAVMNAASFQSGLPSGGALATIFCSGLPLNVGKPGTYLAPTSSPLPYELAGFDVSINGTLAPLLAVTITSSGQAANAQINLQVPLERNVSTFISENYPGFLSACGAAAAVTPLPALPLWGGFFADANGFAAAQHASDYSLVTTQNPAHAGETIIAYADDFFPVWPFPPVGFAVPLQPVFGILSAQVASIRGGSPNYLYLQTYPQLDYRGASWTNTPPVQTTFEGLAPGQVGVEQINFVVPANQQPGNWALFFNIGSCTTPPFQPAACANFGASSPYVIIPVQ